MKNKTKKINNKTHTYSFAKAKYSRFPPKNTKKQFLFNPENPKKSFDVYELLSSKESNNCKIQITTSRKIAKNL